MATRFPTTWDSTAQTAWARGVLNASPVGDGRIVTFGFREVDANHPVPGHSGLDVAADLDTDIALPIDAVHYASYELSGQFGNFSVFRSQELFHLYAHMRDPFRVPTGAYLPAGTVIGQVGMTGFTNGPHLHWMTSLRPDIIYSAQPLLNPMSCFALPSLATWNDVTAASGGNPAYQVEDEYTATIGGTRKVSIYIANPPILGPNQD